MLANLLEVLKICMIFAPIGILAGVISFQAKKKRSKCSNCGVQYNYDNDIAWRVSDTKTSRGFFSSPKAVARVDIACRCSKCGTIKNISRKYKYAEYRKGIFGESVKEKNMDDLVRKDFL